MGSLRQRFRYRFDNYMARGVGAQIGLLALAAIAVMVTTGVLLVVFDAVPQDDKGNPDTFGQLVWRGLTHTLDPGTLGNDPADTSGWRFLLIMLFATIGGVFVVSSLIGVLTQGFGEMIDTWRRGKSSVIERGHTVILGWSGKVPTLLRELAIANASERRPTVVLLADRDKVAMDADVAAAIPKGTRLRVVTRRGSPMTIGDLGLVALAASKAVIVLAPDAHADGSGVAPAEADTIVLKTLLAIAKVAPELALHLVAEVHDPRTEAVARRVVGERAALLLASPLISRLLVQTGRQSGLSAVYSELLDFDGCEIYVAPAPALVGVAFRDAGYRYDTSTLIGVLAADDTLLLPPPLDRPFAAGDRAIVIAEDDSRIALDGKAAAYTDAHVAPEPPPRVHRPERTLVLGASARLPVVLHELDAYVAAGSTTLVVGERPVEPDAFAGLQHMTVATRVGDVTERALLDELDVTSFDHVLVLSELAERTQEMADARTTVALLHLRDIERVRARRVPITSEILDIGSRDLASVAEADDFIVSNTLVSLLVGQVAENPHLVKVFEELFSPAGYELYLKPAASFVTAGAMPWGAVCEAALRRGELAIGYRAAAHAKDPARNYGVVLNPAKARALTIAPGDQIVVLAEES